jgi:hypothetical protein
MAEYVVKGAEPNETVLHTRTPNGYEEWSWLPVRERIVRCRECRYYEPNTYSHFTCELLTFHVDPNDFCAWGERKEVDA